MTRTIVIGGGPVALIEALHRAQAGESVHVVEAADRLGGAWRTATAFGVEGLEIAPHILMPHAGAHRAMRELVPVEYTTVAPQPLLAVTGAPLIGSRIVPIRATREFYLCWALASRLGAPYAWPHRLAHFGGFLWRRLAGPMRGGLFSPTGEGPIYPRHGLDAWMAGFRAALEARGATISTGVRARHLEGRPDGRLLLFLQDGTTEGADHCVITRSSHFTSYSTPAGSHDLVTSSQTLSYLALLVRTARPGRLMVFHGHPEISLINDVTDLAPAALAERHPGCRVLVIRAAAVGPGLPSAEHFMGQLRALDYVAPDAELADHLVQHVEQAVLGRRSSRRILRDLPGRTTLLPFGDLGLTSSFLR